MQRKTLVLFALLVGNLIAWSPPVQSAAGGGFPSIMRLQRLFVSTAASSGDQVTLCANGQASGSRCYTIRLGGGGDLSINGATDAGVSNQVLLDLSRAGAMAIQGNAAGASNSAYWQFNDNTGTRTGYVGDDSAATTGITVESDTGNVCLAPKAGSVAQLCAQSNGSLVYGANAIPRTAYAVLQYVSGTTCTLFAGVGVTGCVFNGTGDFATSFSPGFTTQPVCTATDNTGTNPTSTKIGTMTTAAVEAFSFSNGVAANNTVNIVCVGT